MISQSITMLPSADEKHSHKFCMPKENLEFSWAFQVQESLLAPLLLIVLSTCLCTIVICLILRLYTQIAGATELTGHLELQGTALSQQTLWTMLSGKAQSNLASCEMYTVKHTCPSGALQDFPSLCSVLL